MIALVLVGFAVLIFIILLFPLNISFSSTRSEGTIDGSLEIRWTIFLFIYSMKEKASKVHILGRIISRHIYHEKKLQIQKYKRKRKAFWKISIDKISSIDLLNTTKPLLRLFKDFIHIFKVKYLDIDITFGLEDPAYTGIITGFLHSVGLSRTRHNIQWRADFTKQIFEWDLKGKIVLIPIRLIFPMIKFIMNWRFSIYKQRITRNMSDM